MYRHFDIDSYNTDKDSNLVQLARLRSFPKTPIPDQPKQEVESPIELPEAPAEPNVKVG